MAGRRVEFKKQTFAVNLDPRIMEVVDKHVDPNSLDRQSRSAVINQTLWKVFIENESSGVTVVDIN